MQSGWAGRSCASSRTRAGPATAASSGPASRKVGRPERADLRFGGQCRGPGCRRDRLKGGLSAVDRSHRRGENVHASRSTLQAVAPQDPRVRRVRGGKRSTRPALGVEQLDRLDGVADDVGGLGQLLGLTKGCTEGLLAGLRRGRPSRWARRAALGSRAMPWGSPAPFYRKASGLTAPIMPAVAATGAARALFLGQQDPCSVSPPSRGSRKAR